MKMTKELDLITMQTVNIYFEIGKNSYVFDSSSDQIDTCYANIISPHFFQIFGRHRVFLFKPGVVGRGRPRMEGFFEDEF